MTSEQPKRSGAKWALVGVGTLAVLAGGTYAAGYAMAGDKLPRNSTVRGVPVGGMPSDEAINALKKAVAPAAEAPITLSAGKQKATVTPPTAGLVVDYAGTIEQAGAGKSLHPAHIWNVLSGGGEMKLKTSVDEAALTSALKGQAQNFTVKPADATVSLDRDKVTVKDGVVGTELDVDAAAKAVRSAWMKEQQLEAPLTKSEPAITTAKAKAFVKEQITPRVSAPIIVDLGKGKVELTGPGIGELTKIQAKDGMLTATSDMDKLYKAAVRKAEPIGFDEPQDAKWQLKDGKPVVVPGKPGMSIDRKAFDKAVGEALTKTGAQRTVTVPVTTKQPEVTTEQAQKAKVSEVTGEFTTTYPHADYRNTNLSVVASRINNTYIAPGETFSLNDTIGPRTPGSGFVDGWVVSGDHLVKENAGGISQSGTAVFNALFFSGLQRIEHQPHTMYFSRYPAGREATLYYGHIDVKFKNDSPYGAIIQSWVDKSSPGGKGSMTVKIWSTKVYDKVTSTELVKSNFTTGRKLTRSGPKCNPQAAAPGFTVNYARLFYKGGSVVKREPYSWTYAPTDEITCE
ncbi:VanW family protein [Luteococcus sp. Sow4_B9]|uniref:VanW family protein n=1 Tax=Luteococcus sp. Sow4_B9 TaxID=3438792 RepID=UPI003F9982C1